MPFEIQVLNTLQENFLWTENTDTLLVLNGGLYQISFSLFSLENTPQASLIINGVIQFSSSSQQKSKKSLNQTYLSLSHSGNSNESFLFAEQ